MADKNIIITIKRKPRPAGRPGQPNKRRGPLKGHRRAEILHRRTKPGGIHFYDLGYLKSGSVFNTLGFTIARPVFRDLNKDDLAARDAAIFAITGTDYKDKAYKIRKADGALGKYNLVVSFTIGPDSFNGTLDDVDQFTDENGLVIPDAAAATLLAADSGLGSGALMFLDLIFDNSVIKVTSVYDYNAAAAPFTPSGSMDIFLTPALDLTDAADLWFAYDRSFFLEHDPPTTYPFVEPSVYDADQPTILIAIIKQNGGTFFVWRQFS